ncbi:MAG: futalosine hydrolase [Flavobacteriales bacterium]
MKLLITAATEKELQIAKGLFNQHDTHFLCTGVGMVNTTFTLSQHLSAYCPDLVLNIGIAGAIDHEIKIGDVFLVEKDEFAWFGSESPEGFIPFNMSGTFDAQQTVDNSFHFQLKSFESYFDDYIRTNAITVQTVTGTAESVERLKKHYSAGIESMEGAAFYYVCQALANAYVQLRAVSNHVEERKKSNWKIDEALEQLRHSLIMLSKEL